MFHLVIKHKQLNYVCIKVIKTLFLEDAISLEARLCDYDGKFYCPLHHWNNTAIIPARVLCNWQFEKKNVCQASFHLLNYRYESKIYDLEKHNPKLFSYVESLNQIKVRNFIILFISILTTKLIIDFGCL